MHITRIPLVPNRRNPNLGFAHVVFREADAVQDGLRAALRLGFGDPGAVFVQLERWVGRIDGLRGFCCHGSDGEIGVAIGGVESVEWGFCGGDGGGEVWRRD